MELTHRFSVPLPPDRAWEQFNDIGEVAECFPGATVTEADAESFSGTVKVKLGPIALQYKGSGTFTEKDESARRMVVDAKGKDKRGNGTAGAHVVLTMAEGSDAGSTDIEVVTDLSVTGKPAQFGRGVMQDVSDKLLGQFVSCLEQKHAAPAAPTEAPSQPPTEPLAEPPTGAAADAPSAVPSSGPSGSPTTTAPGSPTTGQDTTAAPAGPSYDGARERQSPEALDLGATVLPVLARTYGPWVLGAVVVLLVLRWLRRR